MTQLPPPADPSHTVHSYRGYLPHVDLPRSWQAITYRLADAMPRRVLAILERESAAFPEQSRPAEHRKRIDRWIDNGHGSGILRRADIASLVIDTWRRFAGISYDLGPWVIMPNHVHVLIHLHPDWPLRTIVASWKSYTAKQIMRMTGAPSPIWWPDYWDRFIRDGRHWRIVKAYIEKNPVMAGLVEEPGEWQWGSACAGREGG